MTLELELVEWVEGVSLFVDMRSYKTQISKSEDQGNTIDPIFILHLDGECAERQTVT